MAVNPQSLGWDLSRAQDAKVRAQKELDLVMLHNGTIDETSLLFPDEESLEALVDYAVGEAGWENFNSVTDTVTREDADGSFSVRFEFLRPSTDAVWRIEAMCVTDGTAPLHERALRESGGRAVVVHASYKLSDEDAYDQEVAEMSQRFAGVGGRRAAYVNSYGRFSYFGVGPTYFKPRVNLTED